MAALHILIALLMQASPPVTEAAGPCPGGRISHVFIDNHSIFDPASLPEEGLLRVAYRAANFLHVKTRADFIETQLLFEEGDCLDPALVRESARILREFRFIAGADAYGIEQPDGTTHVVVDTHDEWTTKLALFLRFDEGLRFEGVQLIEENFLGRGIAVGTFLVQRDEQRDYGVGLEVPRIRGSNWDIGLGLGATRIGSLAHHTIVHPFQSERPGVALRLGGLHRRDFFNYRLPGEGELTHLLIPVQEERLQLAAARRSTVGNGLVLYGGGVSYERVGVGGVSEAEGVRDGDFGSRVPVEPALARELEPHVRDREALRLNLLGGLRRVRFQERRGLDAVAGIQDVPVGHEVVLSVGPSVGSTGPGRPSDVFSRTNLFWGGEVGSSLVNTTLSAETRREGPGRWKDILVGGRGLAYFETEGFGNPVLVGRAGVDAGWRTEAPFQLALGGPDGVRGYSDTALPGGRRVVLSGEGRWRLGHPFPDFADLGFTTFGDVGRMWAGDAPFGQDSGWRAAVGAGVRLGFPAGSSSVIRFDVAIPVDGSNGRRPILRISAREWIGLLDDARSPDLLRSRRSGIGLDFTGVARDRVPPG